MNYDAFGETPRVTPGSTSYFSAPALELDPKLFSGQDLKPWVRTGVLSMLFGHLATRFSNPHQWAHVWLAGSGVSYQWQAAREPGDLDCLVGIDYVLFRQSNPEYIGYSDVEVSKELNDGFNEDLMPNTRNWEGYELTYYVNPQSDIRDINPYAAYDLTTDDWTVKPEANPSPPYSRAWEQRTQRDHDMAVDMLGKYDSALNEIRNTNNPAYRTNAERKLKLAMEQAIAFYDDIHAARHIAFSKNGSGYSDYNNYRWQAGKRSGAVQALRTLKDMKTEAERTHQVQTYGVELPDTSTLIRRTLRG